MKITFFKLPGHYIFDYKPRYYDEAKERREEMIAQAKREAGIKDDDEAKYVPRIKGQIKKQLRYDKAKRAGRTSNLRLIVIIAILVAVAYYLFYSA